jgi:hypothetical protein
VLAFAGASRYAAEVGLLHGILASLFPPRPEPLDEVRPGALATVRGTVIARDLLTSPLSGQACVYYRYMVEEWRRSGVAGLGSDGFWELTARDEAIAEFYLHDGRQRAIVGPHRARIERARGVTPHPVEVGGFEQRAAELLICPGDEIEVTALVERVTDLFDEDRHYRGPITRVLLRAPDGDEILIRVLSRRHAPACSAAAR